MPIESINIPKAPKGWQPTADQQRQIQSDSRLRQMSRDDQYFYFNQPRTPATRRQGAQQPQQRQPAPSSGVFGWVDSITQALRGSR